MAAPPAAPAGDHGLPPGFYNDPLGLFAGQPGSDAPAPFTDAEMTNIFETVARGLNQQLSDEMIEPPRGVYRPRDINEVKYQ